MFDNQSKTSTKNLLFKDEDVVLGLNVLVTFIIRPQSYGNTTFVKRNG